MSMVTDFLHIQLKHTATFRSPLTRLKKVAEQI